MVQVLCYTNHGFNTCWRPGSIAANVAVQMQPFFPFNPKGLTPGVHQCTAAPYTPVRFA